MLLALQLVGVAVVPLNVTALVPWEVPKLPPVIVIALPTAPEEAERELMYGAVESVPPDNADPDTDGEKDGLEKY
jgi:hypothetical protein